MKSLELATIDWVIIVGYFVLTMAISLVFARRAGKNLAEFFVSGRSLPWWIAGTSMVATSFAADTPLAVVGLIAKHGLAGNWFWWAFAFGGMITVFVYSRLWRRSEVMTDVELTQIRYGGAPARGLRYLRAIYVALIINPIVIGWVVGAMATVFKETVFFDTSQYAENAFWNQETLTWTAIIGMMAVVGVYSTLSGLWGVAISDAIQFCLAMAGCVWLAIIAVQHFGGVDGLRAKVEENYGDNQVFNYLPDISAQTMESEKYSFPNLQTNPNKAFDYASSAANELIANEEVTEVVKKGLSSSLQNFQDKQAEFVNNGSEENFAEFQGSYEQVQGAIKNGTPGPWMLMHVFLIMLTMQWWATWYPGAEPGGGGYVVQRMASCKDERHSILATLWYQVAYYCVRPWPWIIIAFAALALYPEIRSDYIATGSDPGRGFPMVMRQFCGPGLAGLMLVAFFAAFMSTISTQMNWGASYLVRDFIQPIFLPNADEKKLTWASRVASVFMLVVGLVAAYLMTGISVDDAWKLLATLGAGTGLVFMLRWFWWRINAWSEISAMVAALGFFMLLNRADIQDSLFGGPLRAEERMAAVAVLTIVAWLLVTFLTPSESMETLSNFYHKVRPGGPGWKPVASENPDVECDQHLGLSIFGAICGAGIVYLTLPAIGYLIFGQYVWAGGCLAGAAACAVGVKYVLNKVLG